jgi:hypothetical protein
MSDPGKFLSRWSRRKREAAQITDETMTPAASEPAVEAARGKQAAPSDNLATPSDATKSPAPTFDLASLPAIELITADTDIRAFLAPGVPPELTRRALRRAWAADPKIREFVGLADYDWDFNTPGSMAGFGPLEMTDKLRQVVARIIGPAPSEVAVGMPDPASADAPTGQDSSLANPGEHTPTTEQEDQRVEIAKDESTQDTGQDRSVNSTDESRTCDELPLCDKEDIAAQYLPEKPEAPQSIVGRSHGRALPK